MPIVRESCGSPREKRNSRNIPGYNTGSSGGGSSGFLAIPYKIKVVAADSDYSITNVDELIIAAPKSTGNATLTLPDLSIVNRGQAFVIKCTDSLGTHNVVIARSGSDVIDDGLTSYSLGQYLSVTIVKAQDVGGTLKWITIADL